MSNAQMDTVAPARASFPCWGGRALVAVTAGPALESALARVRRILSAFELACSNLRRDSELTRLNAYAGDEVIVSALLFLAVRESLRAARWTDGVVDPTASFRAAPGYASVRLGDQSRSITVPSDVRLDLGATASALAADTAAAAASSAAGCGVLVGIRGDVAVAGDPPPAGWGITLTDAGPGAHNHTSSVAVESGGLATSNLTTGRFGTGPTKVGHLIDPTTGTFITGPWQSTAVVASSCLQANVASTAAMILGADAPRWLAERHLTARLIDHSGVVDELDAWPAVPGLEESSDPQLSS